LDVEEEIRLELERIAKSEQLAVAINEVKRLQILYEENEP
jgi:hypothetical protein